ncbi:MAG: hypothetical protein JW993_01000 [Sedimentisphaerales bacterium]|nr:hypothetical protein [Sedimentisphaerales bacterium]
MSGRHCVGGLIGRSTRGTVSRCYSTCTVQGGSIAEEVGGLVGRTERSNINNSYATGDVSGLHYVGGLIGRSTDAGSVTHCYAVGRVTCPQDPWSVPDAGGLIGVVDRTLVTGCFWDTQTSGFSSSAAGQRRTTAQLRKASTFIHAGWDFEGESTNGIADIWCIDEAVDYPKFFQPPVPPPVLAWADNFADGVPAPLWQLYEPAPSAVQVEEVNGRLEVSAPVAGSGVQALYVAKGWMLDGTQGFFVKTEFHFSASDAGEGWVTLGLTPDAANPVAQYVDLTAHSLDREPVYAGRQTAGGWRQRWWADRQCDAGTLYLSYDADRDELYLSFTGYGPVNAWHVATGLIQGRWGGAPLYVTLGGGSVGMEFSGPDAWLDNFSVDEGTVLP